MVADPRLSRFEPRPRILLFDDFDEGLQGWTGLIGNYEDSLDSLLPGFRDLRPPMLSNSTMWDTGSAGAFDGVYAMKLATRPEVGSMGVGIKRVTWRKAGPIRLETYVTFKPEASALKLSELDVRAFGVLFDLQNARDRVMPHLRYLNALDGKQVGRWQYKKDRVALEEIGDSGKTRSHFHLSSEGWLDVPSEPQLLCYNEIPTKQNWHYLRVDFDLESMSFIDFQCNDRVYDGSEIEPMVMPAMANLWCMLNLVFWVETDLEKRAFLHVDSVLLSEGTC
ncbi:MAG: hypothetical protein O2954_17585 [bacterium]|nr:hypothetical protein [bacterium]